MRVRDYSSFPCKFYWIWEWNISCCLVPHNYNNALEVLTLVVVGNSNTS